MKEKIKNKLEDWKTQVDHLEAQLEKGSAEAREEFEKQKENLANWLISTADKLDNVKDRGSEKAQKLKASLEELRVHSALARAETKEQIKEQQLKIAKGIQKIRQELSDAYKESKEHAEDIHEKMDDKLEDFQTTIIQTSCHQF